MHAKVRCAITDIVTAYVANHAVNQEDIPHLVASVQGTVTGLGKPEKAKRRKPAVPVGRSVQHHYIICLEDGRRLKLLTRYLRTQYNLSPSEYRQRWRLPLDYPMVCPASSLKRSLAAKSFGLGTHITRGWRGRHLKLVSG